MGTGSVKNLSYSVAYYSFVEILQYTAATAQECLPCHQNFKYRTMLDGKRPLRNNKCIQLFLENVTQFIT